MALFQLDPQSIADRIRGSGGTRPPGALPASILRGTLGFMVVSIGGFAPWPVFERWVRTLGEMELDLACGVMFIGLSGPCLHRLILGPGSLVRFYKLFSLAFAAYSLIWVLCWTLWPDNAGILAGLLGGTAAMGAIIGFAFDARRAIAKVLAALFTLNTLGYYAGDKIAGKLAIEHRAAGMLLWGLCYGAGLGAGLGIAFHLCQQRARELLSARNFCSASVRY